MKDCVFCKIVKGETPSSIELDTKNVIAFKSIDPASEIHVLIVPKKHIADFVNISPKDTKLMGEMIEVAQKIIKKKKTSSGFKLIFNGGKYPAVKHLHWHILGGKLKDDYYVRI